MSEPVRLAVKTLAAFVHQRGDLYPPLRGRVRPEEGIEAQRRLQTRRPSGYRREYPVQAVLTAGVRALELSGRIDGYDPSAVEVEEIKTTRSEPALAEQYLGSVHWAQLRLYGALLCRQEGLDAVTLVLTYVNPDSLTAESYRELQTAAALDAYLTDTVETYARWLDAQQCHEQQRNRWLAERAFPHGAYRPHQRAMAARVYRAFRDGEHLLLEAPTGSGKTLGVLYPALKALSSGIVERLFFLTARGTGALAPRDACERVRAGKAPLRFIELEAKARRCAVPGTPCSSELCPYAKGYYDRRDAAVRDLLHEEAMDSHAIGAVAERHQVCPFELSLDAALWADVVIGDYNYLLDPVVRLKRFADDEGLGVLVDESHQLGDRARAMLSLSLQRRELRAALAEPLTVPLRRRIEALDRQLLALRRREALGTLQEVEEPVAALRAIARLFESLEDEPGVLEDCPATLELVFNLSRWLRAESWRNTDGAPKRDERPLAPQAVEEGGELTDAPTSYATRNNEGAFAWFAEAEERSGRVELTLKLSCLDAGPYLKRTLSSYGPHVRFSGTVSPLPVYQRLQGFDDAPGERVASLFQPSQLGTFLVPDLSVLYRDREATVGALARLVGATVATAPGNYLIAVPSFAYLELLAAAVPVALPEGVELLVQQRAMEPDAREAFLKRFEDADGVVGLVVLGGVFSESVDYAGAQLKGVVCVGVGLPPKDPERDRMAARFAALPGVEASFGETVAFHQPAMSKVLQMAGRLLRGPEDRGVLVLVDGRFRDSAYQRFFPEHWQPSVVPAASVPGALASFWTQSPACGQERAARHAARLRAPR